MPKICSFHSYHFSGPSRWDLGQKTCKGDFGWKEEAITIQLTYTLASSHTTGITCPFKVYVLGVCYFLGVSWIYNRKTQLFLPPPSLAHCKPGSLGWTIRLSHPSTQQVLINGGRILLCKYTSHTGFFLTSLPNACTEHLGTLSLQINTSCTFSLFMSNAQFEIAFTTRYKFY